MRAPVQRAPSATPARAGDPVRARILWPALGFPAVVTPRARPLGINDSLREGDATRCACVLILSDRAVLSSQEAARYLRFVPWDHRGRRHIPAGQPGSFGAADLIVRSEGRGSRIGLGRRDAFGEQVRFGAAGNLRNGVTALLARRVRDFYAGVGLRHLHEIRVTEAATARLPQGRYHLFWNNERPGEDAPSDEMRLLLDRFARPRRVGLAAGRELDFMLKEYEYEYGELNPPYNQGRPAPASAAGMKRAEILHPLFIEPGAAGPLRIGHVTDTHVDVRADVYEHNLKASRQRTRPFLGKGDYNNFNTSFVEVYRRAASDSGVILMTGDLIDYGRGYYYGQGRPNGLGVDGNYHLDRNWFLFQYLLARGDDYRRPVYTILGNHDWRVNPYPPFAPGAPNPNELLHDFAAMGPKQREALVRIAHGPGHQLAFAYSVNAESKWQLLKRDFHTVVGAIGAILRGGRGLDIPGYPTQTSIESIAWYLAAINPFLDYAFTLPGGQSVLMLDWAQTERVILDDIAKGEKAGSFATGTPKASGCLTPLQHALVAEFAGGPGRAKVIGLHAPPIGPYPEWHDDDLRRGAVRYPDPARARGPASGHPIFAITPDRHVTTPYGMLADRGSLARGNEREWLIRAIMPERNAVRLVFSGHIHRNGLYRVHPSRRPIEIVDPKDPARRRRLAAPVLVTGSAPQQVGGWHPAVAGPGPTGPLYVTTTSAGPRGSFESRALTARERENGGLTTDPGYASVTLAPDGTIGSFEFRTVAPARGRPAVPQPELAFAAR